jgi:hypothetical protein
MAAFHHPGRDTAALDDDLTRTQSGHRTVARSVDVTRAQGAITRERHLDGSLAVYRPGCWCAGEATAAEMVAIAVQTAGGKVLGGSEAPEMTPPLNRLPSSAWP